MWNIKGAIANQDVSLLEFTWRARYKNISQGFKCAIKFLKLFDEITLFRNLFAGPRSNWISQRSSVPEVPARGFLWNQLGLMGVILQVLSSDASECPSCFLPDLVSLVCIDGTKEESLRCIWVEQGDHCNWKLEGNRKIKRRTQYKTIDADNWAKPL